MATSPAFGNPYGDVQRRFIACAALLPAGEDDISAPPEVMERMAAKSPDAARSPSVAAWATGAIPNRAEAFNAAPVRFLS